MKLIPLTKGYFAKVDDDDFEMLSKFKWSVLIDSKLKYLIYARRSKYSKTKGRCITVLMHKEILGNHSGRLDHKDGDGLNNQKHNLRVATPVQNGMNMKLKNAAVPYKGVCTTGYGTFRARISINKKTQLLGCFKTAEQAATAYDNAALLLYGEFARTNQQMGAL